MINKEISEFSSIIIHKKNDFYMQYKKKTLKKNGNALKL